MQVLVGCEFSGRVRNAFRKLGFDAWSCDLLPADDGSPYHIQGDVREVLNEGWSLAIFHPPCTRLCNSGVTWLHSRNLWDELDEAADLFRTCLKAPIPRVAVENPVMHRYAKERIKREPSFSVQPWQFGDPYKKRTCFWTRGLRRLVPTSNMTAAEATQRCHYESPSPFRWKKRSITYPGLAAAMADQWSKHLIIQEAA